MVIKSIEDLPTLRHLLQSSSVANIIFGNDCAAIIEAVLVHYPPGTKKLLGLILRLKSKTVPEGPTARIPTIEDFIAASLGDGPVNFCHISKSSTTTLAASELVRTADTIQQLAHTFLMSRLGRTGLIKPSYLSDPGFRYDRDYPREPLGRQPYEPIQCGPPSWIEYQRVTRALWRLELYFELLAMEPQIAESVGAGFVVALRHEGPHRLWTKIPAWEAQEMDCVYKFLLEVSSETRSSSHLHPYLSALPSVPHQSFPEPVPYPPQDSTQHTWCQAEMYLDRLSPGYRMMKVMKVRHDSPIQKCDLEPFLDLGFCIWDTKRTVLLGLVAIPARVLKLDETISGQNGLTRLPTSEVSAFDMFTRWKSVLDHLPKSDQHLGSRAQTNRHCSNEGP